MVVSGKGMIVNNIFVFTNKNHNNPLLFSLSQSPTFVSFCSLVTYMTSSTLFLPIPSLPTHPLFFFFLFTPICSSTSSSSHPSSLLSSLTSIAQKGLLHLSPDVYQEMEASRKQGGSAPGPGGSNGGSVNYMTPKDMGPCSAPLPSGHPPYYSASASSPSPTATMARELLLNGQSPTADASLPMKGKNPSLACGISVQPAQQLDYLARIQGFQVRCGEVGML